MSIVEHHELLVFAGTFSAVTFVASLLVVPWLVVRLPEDYFALPKRRIRPWSRRGAAFRWAALIGKNALGILLILMGLAMLVLPGQGLLTILIGLVLLDFPGKYALERRLVRLGPVLRSINWLRRRAGCRELVIRDR